MYGNGCIISDQIFQIPILEVEIRLFLLSVEECVVLFFYDFEGVVVVFDDKVSRVVEM